GVREEVRQHDVVVETDAEAEAADAGPRRLLTEHDVEPEVVDAASAVPLGDGHAQEAGGPRRQEDLARHDAVALPLRVVRDDLLLQESAEAVPECLVLVLEQVAAHRVPSAVNEWQRCSSHADGPARWRGPRRRRG